MQRAVRDFKDIGLPCKEHRKARRQGYDDRDDCHRSYHAYDAAGDAGALRLLRLSRADVHAHHGGHRRAEGSGQYETHRGNICRDALTVQDYRAIFLRFVVDEVEAQVEQERVEHSGQADPAQLVQRFALEAESLQFKSVGMFLHEEFVEHPCGDDDIRQKGGEAQPTIPRRNR